MMGRVLFHSFFPSLWILEKEMACTDSWDNFNCWHIKSLMVFSVSSLFLSGIPEKNRFTWTDLLCTSSNFFWSCLFSFVTFTTTQFELGWIPNLASGHADLSAAWPVYPSCQVSCIDGIRDMSTSMVCSCAQGVPWLIFKDGFIFFAAWYRLSMKLSRASIDSGESDESSLVDIQLEFLICWPTEQKHHNNTPRVWQLATTHGGWDDDRIIIRKAFL